MDMKETALRVKEASRTLASLDDGKKNDILRAIAAALDSSRDEIVKANITDCERSEKEKLAFPLLKRLRFDESKIRDVIDGINSLVTLPDPAGRTLLSTELDEGLELYRVSCPIGVIGIIFESRPDALVQISTLCLKSGNGVILKGGSEARETNRVLAKTIADASIAAGAPEGWIALLETRDDVNAMLAMDGSIDLIIPRGSNEFVRYIMDHTRIPVMGHADGICHLYIDRSADIDMAVRIAVDSKIQYVAVCNAVETLLVHKDIARDFLPALKKAMDEKKVTLVGCEKTRAIIEAETATEDDWKTEYLDYKLAVRVVDSTDAAIDHINEYGSKHTDSIVSADRETAAQFLDRVDSGNVFWNCSTRFSDGFKFGFGAEVGVSTSKLHARGPVGLEGLVSYKYILVGSGQIVDDYATRRRHFTHRQIDKKYSV
jgi:glutamate-5-semialdehyde dehydrogenase